MQTINYTNDVRYFNSRATTVLSCLIFLENSHIMLFFATWKVVTVLLFCISLSFTHAFCTQYADVDFICREWLLTLAWMKSCISENANTVDWYVWNSFAKFGSPPMTDGDNKEWEYIPVRSSAIAYLWRPSTIILTEESPMYTSTTSWLVTVGLRGFGKSSPSTQWCIITT